MVRPLVPPAVDVLGPYLTTPQSVSIRPGRTGDAAGSGFSWFRDCTDDNAEDGTPLTAEFMNNLKAQHVTAFQAAGLEVDDDSLLAWVIQLGMNFAVATGTANAWVVAPPLAVPAYAAGRVLWVKAPATNTSTTVNANVSGLGNRRVKRADGTDPAVGDLIGSRIYPLVDDGTNLCALTIGSGTPIQKTTRTHFTTPGSRTFTATRTGWHKFTVWGGGGGGGYGTGGASGGSPGAWFEAIEFMTAGQTAALVVGAAGAAGISGQNGGTGGASSVVVNGTTYSAAGGPGGLNANAGNGANAPAAAATPSAGDSRAGGDQGAQGNYFGGSANPSASGGRGGSARNGGSGGVGGGGSASPGQQPGGGGGGSANSGTAGAGGAGQITVEF